MINNDVPYFVNLPYEAEPYYYDVLSMRKKWSKLNMIYIVQLSRMLSQYRKFAIDIENEGTVIDGQHNYKVKMVESLDRRIQSYCRVLKIDAFNEIGRPRDNVNKNQVKRRIVEVIERLDGDDLIALPIVGKD